jgi:hypothetical protein
MVNLQTYVVKSVDYGFKGTIPDKIEPAPQEYG